jgi:hypothetical protein
MPNVVLQNIDLEGDFAAAVLSVCGPLPSYYFILPVRFARLAGSLTLKNTLEPR